MDFICVQSHNSFTHKFDVFTIFAKESSWHIPSRATTFLEEKEKRKRWFPSLIQENCIPR